MKTRFIRSRDAGVFTPAAVQGLLVTVVSSTELDLSWQAIAGVENYTVRRNGDPIVNLNATSFQDVNLAANTRYVYTVAAINPFGEGPQSAPVTGQTLPAQLPPGQVQSLAGHAVSTSEIDLAWNPVVSASLYTVDRDAAVIAAIPGTSYADTGLAAGTQHEYTVTASNNAGSGPASTAIFVTTNAPVVTGGIVFTPGVRLWFGNASNVASLATYTAPTTGILADIKAKDINHQIKGICISMPLAYLIGPTRGQYDNFSVAGRATSDCGMTFVGNFIGACKAQGLDVTIMINCTGNGVASVTSFNSNFCPAYMNSSTFGGGMAFPSGSSPMIIFWNANVAADILAMMGAYQAKFGPDTPTGGIYRWNFFQELSPPTATGFTAAKFLTVWPTYCQTFRSNCPNTLGVFSPTYVSFSTSDYADMFAPAFAHQISVGNEDTCNEPTATWGSRWIWGDVFFSGRWWTGAFSNAASNPPVPMAGITNYLTNGPGGTPTWDFHGRIDPSELFNARTLTAPSSPASIGSGYLYDDAANGFPGMWTHVNQMLMTHVDCYGDAYGGSNIYRRTGVSGAPPNPTPGPGAGLTATRPGIIDVFTGNTTYPGITGPLTVPGTRPASY